MNTCCLLFAFALLLAMTPAQLDAACTHIHCERQSQGCISQTGGMQVARSYGLPILQPARFDWAAIDEHIWDGVVLHAWPWADESWTPDSPTAHSYYCQGDAWLPALQLRVLHCWSVDELSGTWWSVPFMQEHWTGWAAVRTK